MIYLQITIYCNDDITLTLPLLALQQITNMNVIADKNTLLVQWDPVTSPCDISYIILFKLMNRDQCYEVMDCPFQTLSLTDTSTRITNLEYHSTYTIQVTARQNGEVVTSTMASEKGTTKETGKFAFLSIYHGILIASPKFKLQQSKIKESLKS